MGKGEKTREAIIDQALKQCVQSGFHGTTLGNLAQAVDISKSGLFAHFKSKEALELAVLEEATARFRIEVVVPAMRAAEGLPQLKALFEKYLRWIDGKHPAGGCPFVTLSQELDDESGPTRDLLVEVQTEWRAVINDVIKRAIRLQQLPASVDPRQLAFELVGIGLSYQVSSRLLKDRSAKRKARKSFSQLIENLP